MQSIENLTVAELLSLIYAYSSQSIYKAHIFIFSVVADESYLSQLSERKPCTSFVYSSGVLGVPKHWTGKKWVDFPRYKMLELHKFRSC